MTIVVQSTRRRPLTSSEEGVGEVAFKEIAETPRETKDFTTEAAEKLASGPRASKAGVRASCS
jgi:hypothetical protein